MKKLAISLVVLATMSLAFVPAFAAVNLASITYYSEDTESATVAHVTVTYTNGQTESFKLQGLRYQPDLYEAIAKRTNIPLATVYAITEKVDPPSWGGLLLSWWKIVLLAVFGMIVLFSTAFIVRQQEVVIIEFLGKYSRYRTAGLRFKLPFVERVAKRLSLRTLQLVIPVETKTEDNTFITVHVAVQYRVKDPMKATYELQNPEEQMKSFVFNVVRAKIPSMKIDAVFENQDALGNEIKTTLSQKMENYGFEIADAPVSNIDPPEQVKKAMNEVVAQQRHKLAAIEKAEGEKQAAIREAEGRKEGQRLSGEGVAAQRFAIIKGFKDSVELFRDAAGESIPETTVMSFALLSQYFQMMERFAEHGKTNLISMPYSPNGLVDLFQQMTTAVASGLALNGEKGSKA